MARAPIKVPTLFKSLHGIIQINYLMVKRKSSGIVNSVRFDNEKTYLKLNNGKEIFLHDVENFEVPEQ